MFSVNKLYIISINGKSFSSIIPRKFAKTIRED